MATRCNPLGVTIVEVDSHGKIVKTDPGYGQTWRVNQKANCGSLEWLSELVLTPSQGSLMNVIEYVEMGGTFKGNLNPGTSLTSCQSAMYRLDESTVPKPGEQDYKYYVMAQ